MEAAPVAGKREDSAQAASRRRSYPFRSASLITHSAAKAVSPVERGAPPPSTALTKSSIHG